jgi:hypothetical protein
MLCVQDVMTTISRHAMISSTSMPRLSTVSTPKTACKYTKDSVYATKGKYDKYAKEAAFVKEGND